MCLRVDMSGDVCVPGDSDRSHGNPAVHLQGLLQPGGAGSVQQHHQLLRLRLVQCLGPGTACLQLRGTTPFQIEYDEVSTGWEMLASASAGQW